MGDGEARGLPPMRIGARTFDWNPPVVMGILNVTPDSFYDGGRWLDAAEAVERAHVLEADGADIIDVGGESTRPGCLPVSVEEEIERVVPVIRAIRENSDIPVSVDTTKSEVAREAVRSGADLVNDISGLRFDPDLAGVAAEGDLPMVLMHSRHHPEDMQRDPHYDDLRGEILTELGRSVDRAVERGVARDRIIVDPGIGFAKSPRHNIEILATPDFLGPLGLPVLVGPSNKSFIGWVTDDPVERRTGGTAAAVAAAVLGGCQLVRVHDVGVMRQAALVAHAVREARR